jgi:hypothetical protein
MSIRSVVVSAIILAAAACAETPVTAPDESTVDQATRPPPVCLPGDTVVTWTEPSGVCGRCNAGGIPGQPTAHYAACSNEIDSTRRVVDTSCEAPC